MPHRRIHMQVEIELERIKKIKKILLQSTDEEFVRKIESQLTEQERKLMQGMEIK